MIHKSGMGAERNSFKFKFKNSTKLFKLLKIAKSTKSAKSKLPHCYGPSHVPKSDANTNCHNFNYIRITYSIIDVVGFSELDLQMCR